MCTFVYGQIILWGSTFSGILWQRERVGCLSLRFLYEIQKKVKKEKVAQNLEQILCLLPALALLVLFWAS